MIGYTYVIKKKKNCKKEVRRFVVYLSNVNFSIYIYSKLSILSTYTLKRTGKNDRDDSVVGRK